MLQLEGRRSARFHPQLQPTARPPRKAMLACSPAHPLTYSLEFTTRQQRLLRS